MKPVSYLDDLKHAAERASVAEDSLRREIAQRVKAAEQERAIAFRRLNLMRAIAETIASAESEEIAVAGAGAALRARLGWNQPNDMRDAIITQFAAVAQAMFADLAPPQAEQDQPDVLGSLAEFERWYAQNYPTPFWTLFENYMPETPVVDF
jgi:hypothetical protein